MVSFRKIQQWKPFSTHWTPSVATNLSSGLAEEGLVSPILAMRMFGGLLQARLTNTRNSSARNVEWLFAVSWTMKLRHIKFVTPRQAVLKKLEADDNRTQNDSSTEDCCDENSDTNSKNRRVGGSRRKSLLDKHGSIDRILSYPKDVCVEVGYEWTVDIISHLLRDDGICKRNKQQNDAKSQQCGKKQKRQRATKTTKTAPIKRKRERQNTNSRVCDTTVRVSCDMNSEVQGDCELFEQIFPEGIWSRHF